MLREFSGPYRGTSLIRNSALLRPYSRAMSRAIWWVLGGGGVSYERGTPVQAALNDDIDTPKVLRLLRELSGSAQKAVSNLENAGNPAGGTTLIYICRAYVYHLCSIYA